MEIISNNPEIGDAREEIPVTYQGEEMTIAFNPRYFMETLAVMNSKVISAKMIDESSACIISGEEDEGFFSVIMPMRLWVLPGISIWRLSPQLHSDGAVSLQ